MSTSSPTPSFPDPDDNGQDTTGFTPNAGGRTFPLPSTPSSPTPRGDDASADVTADFPPSSQDPSATASLPPTGRDLTRDNEATSPDETGAYTPGGRPPAAAPSSAPQVRANRYALKRFHAKGGMGEVWLAEDCDVGRAVALKRMRRKGTPEEQERFLREARITGQLEHPGIVPVHEVGSDENGQPIYVMKFIHGRTLTDAIKEYQHPDPTDKTPREVHLLRLLEVFVSLCQTVAYAHSRGVLHRDLKPDNVMLGPYGETLVLDWGLAKVIGQVEGATGGVSVVLSTSGESMESVAGSVRGTPGYMPPEMAGGEVEAIDQLSDVYLLGATLYQILTGRQLRRGKSLPALLKEAMAVAPPAPRSFDPTISRPLDAICTKAMAFAKADRYSSAGALAEDMQRYLAGEPVAAYPEGWLARAGRWARKHRQALGRAAVAALILGVGLTAFILVWNERTKAMEADQKAKQEAEANRLQKEASDRLAEFDRKADESQFYLASVNPTAEQAPYFDPRKGEDAGREALAVADKLDGLPLKDGERDKVTRQEYDLLLLLAQARVQDASEEGARQGLDLLARAETLGSPSAGLHRLRADCYRLLRDDRADAERRQAESGESPLTAPDHFLRGDRYRDDAFRPDAKQQDAAAGKTKRDLLDKAMAEYREALRLSPDHFWAHFQLGRCYLSLGADAEGAEALGACVALKPDSPWAYTVRGLALARLKRYDAAEADFSRALTLAPNQLTPRLNRGYVLSQSVDPEKEKQALADFEAVLAAPPGQRLIEAAFYRARLSLRHRHWADAQRDLDLVAAEKPDFRDAQRLRALLHLQTKEEGKALDALTAYLAAGRPVDADSAEAYEGRGRLLGKFAGDLLPEARAAALNLAVEQFRKAGDLGASSADFLADYATALSNIDDNKGAIEKFTVALKLKPDDVKLLTKRGWSRVFTADPKQIPLAAADFGAAVRRDPTHAEAHSGLGYVLAEEKDSVAALREAHLATLYGGGDYGVLHNVATVYAALANSDVKRQTEYEDLAIDSLRRAVEWWRRAGKTEPSELGYIKEETAFKDHLKNRPEFIAVVKEAEKP
jgi:tRNA A-37 threonylcarbamoyl transferase component Bud32/Flp pilus assembly protein TadD